MKTFELAKTSIPDQYAMDVLDQYAINYVRERVPNLYRILFATMADILKNHESKDNPRIGFSIKDEKGNFKIGAILIYQNPEEDSEEDTGNWYLQMTFDESDMTNLNISLDNYNAAFGECANRVAWNVFSGRFVSVVAMNQMFCVAIDNIIKFLDCNASDEEEVELVFHGIFIASVAIEKGEKVMSIVPGDYIKKCIKDDAKLSDIGNI